MPNAAASGANLEATGMTLGMWKDHSLVAAHEGHELYTEDLWKYASMVVWVANAGGLSI